MSAIRECPFCNGVAEAVEGDFYRDASGTVVIEWDVECTQCHAVGPYKRGSTKEQAIERWNQRVKLATSNCPKEDSK